MKYKLIAITLMISLTLTAASAQDSPPNFPDLFYGDLTVNGGDASIETKVVTKVDGEFSGNITTDQVGQYGYSDPAKKQLSVSSSNTGQPIKFFVEEYDGNLVSVDSQSQDVDYRAEGDIRQVDLEVSDVQLNEPGSGSNFKVDLDDEAVDEGDSVDLVADVSNAGNSADYDWSIDGDDYGASLTDVDEDSATFNAPSSISQDREVEVSLEVTKSGDNSKTGSATVSIVDSEPVEEQTGQEQQEEQEEQGEEQEDQAQQDELPDTDNQSETNQEEPEQPVRRVNASVDEESGTASANVETQQGESVSVSVPESVDSDGSRVESVTVTSSRDQNVSTSVRDLDEEEVDSEGIERTENQLDFQEINVDGEISDASITFTVSKDRLSERGADPSQVVKQRFDPENGGWENLETRQVDELDDRYRFEADVPEFSVFATSIQTQEEAVDGSVSNLVRSDNVWVVAGLVLLVSVLAATGYKRREEISEFVEEKMTGMSTTDSESEEDPDYEFKD